MPHPHDAARDLLLSTTPDTADGVREVVAARMRLTLPANTYNTAEHAHRLWKEIVAENGVRLERLKAKCRWERMTALAVLKEWGDPATWDSRDPALARPARSGEEVPDGR